MYSFRTYPLFQTDKYYKRVDVCVAICVPTVVGSMWQVGASHGRAMLHCLFACSLPIIMYLIVSNRLATECYYAAECICNAGVAQFLLDTNLELIAANQMALDIFLDGEEFQNYGGRTSLFSGKKKSDFYADGGVEEYVYRGKTYECRGTGCFPGKTTA